jgi:hypothetical protein
MGSPLKGRVSEQVTVVFRSIANLLAEMRRRSKHAVEGGRPFVRDGSTIQRHAFTWTGTPAQARAIASFDKVTCPRAAA